MSDHSRAKTVLLRVTPFLGVGLLAYLLTTVRLSALAGNAKAIGWGMLLVIALGGLSHVIKTLAWRLTMVAEARKVSFARMLGLRLISEAIGQFGFVGMLGGEAARVSLLGSGVSVAGAISSVALDRTLFILAGAVVTIAGIVGLLVAVSVSHAVHYYAAAARAWTGVALGCRGNCDPPKMAGAFRVRPCSGAHSVVPEMGAEQGSNSQSSGAADRRVLPRSAARVLVQCASQLLCHFLAIIEVYLIVRMLGAPATLLGALILESLTKLINVVGSVNPGNVGTYEGGNMVIGRLVRLTGTQGLLLALCRRLRGIFWAIIGGICLVWFSRKQKPAAIIPNLKTDHSQDVQRQVKLCVRRLHNPVPHLSSPMIFMRDNSNLLRLAWQLFRSSSVQF